MFVKESQAVPACLVDCEGHLKFMLSTFSKPSRLSPGFSTKRRGQWSGVGFQPGGELHAACNKRRLGQSLFRAVQLPTKPFSDLWMDGRLKGNPVRAGPSAEKNLDSGVRALKGLFE